MDGMVAMEGMARGARDDGQRDATRTHADRDQTADGELDSDASTRQ